MFLMPVVFLLLLFFVLLVVCQKFDVHILLCRKKLLDQSLLSRAKHWLMQKATFTEDCVSAVDHKILPLLDPWRMM